MPVGIEVINSSGQFQINDEFSNMHMTAKGTLSLVSNPLWLNQGQVVFVEGVNPIMMFGPNIAGVGGACIIEKTAAPGGFNFRIMSYSFWGGASAGTVQIIPYYVFDTKPPTPSNFGLQIFNSSGVLKFDSQSKFLKIKAMAVLGEDGEIPVPFGKVYAACMARSPFWREDTGEEIEMYGYCAHVNQSRVKVQLTRVDEPMNTMTVPRPSTAYLTPTVIVADVTNY